MHPFTRSIDTSKDAHPASNPDAIRPSAAIIPFPATLQSVLRGSERVADVLLALEAAPLSDPRINAVRCVDGVHRVGVGVGDQGFVLTPDEARCVGACLWADPGMLIAGFAEVALRFQTAADDADRGQTQDRR